MSKKKRTAAIKRDTKETRISLSLDLDGSGEGVVDTGIGFFNHMLELFKKHALVDLTVKAAGDTDVDYHHTVEDVGLVLGRAIDKALGDRKGIVRYGNMILPMDESLILTAVDLSGRSHLTCELQIPTEKVGDFDTELVEEFWTAFVRSAEATLHIRQLSGSNSHHIIEGTFKSAARCLRQAVSIDPLFADEIPSTKGVL